MPYPSNQWYVACIENELDAGKPVSAQILSSWIVVWRSHGEVVAMEDRCVHRAAKLSLGRCEEGSLRCMYHGIRYDAGGNVVEIPGQAYVPENARVRAYPVVVRYGWVWVWMGKGPADHSLLPELPDDMIFDDFITGTGALDYATEARLISDNLLDFSHLTFVHAVSFAAKNDWANSPMEIRTLDRGVRAERWITETDGPGYLGLTDTVDEWMGYDYLVPGVLIMQNGIFPKGTARASHFKKPDFSHAIGAVALNLQAVTPKTERTTRYYFLTGPHRNFGDEHARDAMVALNFQAFDEDKIMIEAQQQMLDATPDRPIIPTVHDRGVTIYNRMIQKMTEQEAL